jgi:putative glycosyltransferase (TIGR04372 family)
MWATPILLVIRLIRPWFLIRIGELGGQRIGHFVADAAIYLANEALDPNGKRSTSVYWFATPTCNAQWARMVSRQLRVRWWVRYLIRFNRLIPGGAGHDLPSVTGSRDMHGLLQQTPIRFEFTAAEEQKAKDWLGRRGWREGDPFVCLLVRDSAYLSSMQSAGKTASWSYHDFRDSDSDAFANAVQALLDRGYWVVRMGKVMHKPLPLRHTKLIDYPFVDDQDDLMDIWLSANCHFFVSTSSGIDWIPVAYRKPCVWVNFLPIGLVAFWAHLIWAPKKLRWKDNGRLLTLKEYLNHNYFSKPQYDVAGLIIEDLSPAEITAVVLEMEQRLCGIWDELPQDRTRQERVWTIYQEWSEFSKHHSYRHPGSRIGRDALETMGKRFLE